jgi:hypothetical protein
MPSGSRGFPIWDVSVRAAAGDVATRDAVVGGGIDVWFFAQPGIARGMAEQIAAGFAAADSGYKLDVVLTGAHTQKVIVDWTDEFDRWLDHAEKQGGRLLATAAALLQALTDLPSKPAEESATFKRVRQARRHELWRVAHPFDPEVAVRVICWFPAKDEVVIALIGFDKKAIGDVFYASAAARGEALVDAWLRQKGNSDDR